MNAADRIKEYLRPLCSAGIALAFSGGTDSALLLAVLHDLHKEPPLFTHSPFFKKKRISVTYIPCALYTIRN